MNDIIPSLEEIHLKIDELEKYLVTLRLDYPETLNKEFYLKMCEVMADIKVLSWNYIVAKRKYEERIYE